MAGRNDDYGKSFQGGRFVAFFKPRAALLGVALLAALAMGLCLAQPAWADEDSSDETYNVTVTGVYHQADAYSMLAMINKFRTAEVDENDGNTPWAWNETDTKKVHYDNLKELKWSTKLERIAMQRAAECSLRNEHVRPNGKICFTVAEDIEEDWGEVCGENLTTSYGLSFGDGTAQNAFERLREDDVKHDFQGHRLNMLGNWTSVGIACFESGGNKFWVQAFGNDNESTVSPLADVTKSVQVELKTRYVPEFSPSSPLSYSLSMVSNRSMSLPSSIAEVFDSSGVEFTVPLSVAGWTVESGDTVVELDNGKLTAINPGKAIVSNTVLGSKVSWTITVAARKEASVINMPTSKTANLSVKEFTLSPTCASNGARSFKSSNESVATVSSDGVVTLKGTGNADITVTYAATDDYEIASATCSLAVTNSNVNADSWTKDPDKDNTWTTPDGNQVIINPGTNSSTVTPAAKVSNPAKTKITKLKKAKKAFTVKWKKKSGVTGYQIRYSLKSSMKGAKTVTVKSVKTVSKKVKKLKKKKKYYVQVRTYKVVNGKTYWSGWSVKKSVKTK